MRACPSWPAASASAPGCWYRGPAGAPMEAESRALLRVVQEERLPRPLSFAVDCHSGYGWRDSIWFPYAGTRRPMAHLPEMYLLKTLFEQAHPHHGYTFEPQSHQYLLHGDLWDHAYDLTPHGNLFLPMTLELGSWLWIKKNPRQLFSREGIFNPIKAHRTARVLRRHVSLFDFLGRVAFAPVAGCARRAARRSAAAGTRTLADGGAAMSRWVFLRGLTRESRHWGSLPARRGAAGLGGRCCPTCPATARCQRSRHRGACLRWSPRCAASCRRRRARTLPRRGDVAGRNGRDRMGQRLSGGVGGLVLVNTSMRPFSRRRSACGRATGAGCCAWRSAGRTARTASGPSMPSPVRAPIRWRAISRPGRRLPPTHR